MKYSDLSALSDEQLVHRELQLERDMLELRFRLKTDQLENTSMLNKIRKDIARIRTAQRARERAQGLPKDILRNKHRSSFRPGALAQATAAAAAAGGGFLQGIAEKIGVGDDAAAE
ncbi:MAG: 50S ribosomal protein L29 [Myxococcota bacterium]